MPLANLERFGSRPALVTEDGDTVTYDELCRRADAFAAGLDAGRGLLLIEMSSEVAAVVAYIGALRARVPVILAAPGTCVSSPHLLDAFSPDHIYCKQDGEWVLISAGATPPTHHSHPDLAVLLSTSGSTGSPKLVKLSLGNLSANAASIAEYLEIDGDRVAITNLPLHYSYGLSVLNSFLACGARVVLTDHSVVDDVFWALARRECVTDFGGVPYTYELLERSGFRSAPPPSLRVMTQAGGRLSPELVTAYAAFANSRGIRFFVMYGQTEATARMAYLPPELAGANPDCIGIPIPGGQFEILGPGGETVDQPGVPGELVYRGPNVMMGYAFTREDLLAGPSLEELHTGDIAQREPNGLVRIVGRASRFSKIAGVRIGLDDVERIVSESGGAGFAAGTDECVFIALTRGNREHIERAVAARCDLPQRFVLVMPVPVPPTLATGKIDYQTIKRLGIDALAQRKLDRPKLPGLGVVEAVFREALSLPSVDPDRSFVELGGDSLSYVTVSLGLEAVLGELPPDWQNMPVAALQSLVDSGSGGMAGAGTSPRLRVGMDVILRLMAISLVFVGHGAPDVTGGMRGGSSILFMLAGFSLATYQMPQLLSGGAVELLRGTFVRLVLPYLILMTVLLFGSSAEKSPAWYVLGSVFVMSPEERGPLFSFWFIESLVHAIILSCLLSLMPPVRTALRSRPFGTSFLLLAAAGLLCLVGARAWPNGNAINLTLDGWLYAFFLGWTLHFADTPVRRLCAVLLALAIAVLQFGPDSSRPWWLLLAALALAFVPAVRLPRDVARVLASLAGATYFMYLAHAVVVHVVRFGIGARIGELSSIGLVYAGSVVVGLVYARMWSALMVGSRRFLARWPR
jgi:acyl-CoA synthetase (AMP-forming)/AMP-acid ligase II